MTRDLEVIVFTYNHEEFIERALRSVLSQKVNFPIKLRIHDDASADGTVDVINEVLADSWIPWELAQAPENRYANGISYFHEFMAESQSEFIAILDGDDFWLDDAKLQEQVDALVRLPSAALCHHPVAEFSYGDLTTVEWPPADVRQELIPGSMLAKKNIISTSSVVLRTTMLPRKMPKGFNRL